MKTLRLLILLPALAAAFGVSAKHPMHSEVSRVHYVGSTTDSVAITEALIANAPEEFSSVGLPRLALLGSSGRFAIGLGGYVKATVSYDMGNPIASPTMFTTSEIPVPGQKGNDGLFQVGVGTSRIYVNAVGITPRGHSVGAFAAINFLGDNLMPKMQYAYVRMGGLQLGYDYSLFFDVAATPPTVDYEGPNACPAVLTAGVRYSHHFGPGKKLSAGGACEFSKADYTVATLTEKTYQRYPDIPLYFRYGWNPGGWVRISAMLRGIEYRDMKSDANKTVFGWGLSLSGSSQLGRSPLTLYWQATGGQGISTCYQDLSGMPVDLMPAGMNPTKLTPVGSAGGYIGLQYNITPRLMTSANYSLVRLYHKEYVNFFPVETADNRLAWGDQYKFAQYCAANLTYSFYDFLKAGVEYDFGERVNMDGQRGHDNRVQFMVKLYF